MKKLRTKIEIEVWGIEVEETQHFPNDIGCGWYTFQYSIRVNGGRKRSGDYDGTWSGQTRDHFRRALSRPATTRNMVLDRAL